MKILIINWRDPQSFLEGGAERFTKKYGKYWAEQNHRVTWLTNSFSGSKEKETKDGITYIRIGPELDGLLLKYIFLYPIYLFKTIIFANNFIKKEKVDIVIDEIHGFPFFTPLFSKTRNVLLTCEVAGPIWDKMFPFPISLIGKWIEKLIYQIYKKTEIWAISENTKKNIRELLPKKKVKVIDLGVDENKEILKKIRDVKKTLYPSAVFLARLVKMKGIETAIEAAVEIAQEMPDFKLFVIGEGSKKYKDYLKNRVQELNIFNNVNFLGKVSELKKYEYLKKSYFLLHPSYKEGFGLTILEAGLVGTPSIIRGGSSMDKLIKKNFNGYRFNKPLDIHYYFKNIKNKRVYSKMSSNAQVFANGKIWKNVLKNYL